MSRLILTPSAFGPGTETILMQARRHGHRHQPVAVAGRIRRRLQLAPVAVEDLLLRPSVKIDYARLEAFLKDKSVVVTGGGGSIGMEICDRVVAFGARRLLIVENSELVLYVACRRHWPPSGPKPR